MRRSFAALFGLALAAHAGAESLPEARYASLTGAPGDPARGRAIVANRQSGLCLLCHRAPLPEERFQGELAPDLAGVGGRWSEAGLRQRLLDPASFNPDSIMPAFGKIDGLYRVAEAYRNRPLLTAEEIEDVVAFLLTLRE